MAKPTDLGGVEARLDREHHARTDDRVVPNIEERTFVVAQPNGVTAMMLPVAHQVVLVVVGAHGSIDVGATCPRPQRG